MEIRNATAVDIPLIRAMAHETWPVAYKEIISGAQLEYMLELIYSTSALKSQMAKGHLFVIAIDNKKPIGFASFSPHTNNSFRLHKLYVLPDIQSKGCGSFLLNHVKNEAAVAGAELLELNVNRFNAAKIFYEKHGFAIDHEEVIDIGGGYVMDDYVMKLKLTDEYP